MKHAPKLLAVLFGILLVFPVVSSAAQSVPQVVIDAREQVYRIVCKDEKGTYSGSGFVVAANELEAYIATNYHVVEGARTDTIALVLRDGDELRAEIVGYDEDADVCLLKTASPLQGAKPLPLSDGAAIEVGSAVYALGFPGAGDMLLDDYAYAADEITLTDGIVSAIKHVTVDTSEITLLQMSATINSGSSGGPLMNSVGKAVGINTLQVENANDVYAAVSVVHLRQLMDTYHVTVGEEKQPSKEVQSISVPAAPKTERTPLIPILAVAGAAIAVAVILFLFISRRRRLTVETLMQRRLQGYSFEEAFAKLLPVMQALVPLHVRGEAHGGICPANLFVDAYGNFTLGKPQKKHAADQQNAPYRSMEQYTAGENPGTYSDVYALACTLFYLLTRKPPDTVLGRLQNDTIGDTLRGCMPEEEERALAALLTALALKKEDRLHDVGAFANALGMRDALHMPLPKAAGKTTVLERPAKEISRRAVLIGCAAVLLCGIGVLWILNEKGYRATLAYVEDGDYTAARDAITETFVFYKDAKELAYYVNSGYFLALGYYDEAKDRFDSMEGYRDAAAMAQECEYQKAISVLNSGDYAAAKKAFESLDSYSDAKNMALECDYRNAQDLLKGKQYDQARRLFEKLPGYRDAVNMAQESKYQKALGLYQRFINATRKERADIDNALKQFRSLSGYSNADDMVTKVEDAIYKEGVRSLDKAADMLESLFNNTDALGIDGIYNATVTDAQYYFWLLPSDKEQTETYREICDILWKAAPWKETCEKLSAYWEIEQVQRMLQSDALINYFLIGSWKGNGHYFKMKYNAKDGFELEDDFADVYVSGYQFGITSLIYSVGNDRRGWREVGMLYFTDSDTMQIYVFKNKEIYTLKRQ